MLRTNKQTDALENPTHANRHSNYRTTFTFIFVFVLDYQIKIIYVNYLCVIMSVQKARESEVMVAVPQGEVVPVQQRSTVGWCMIVEVFLLYSSIFLL